MQNRKLFVGNLNYSVGQNEITELFSNYGEVSYAKIIEGKGFGFVEMANEEQANNAKNSLNGTDFKGRTLNIDIAKPQTFKPRGNGGGGRR
ncbi:RNA-binding protein [Leptospira langatensis]|uniref:RNA-binding protein n=1 Tax=Leptospira langatensis TaxID=2484983 RepID=A0A5F1ZQJ0_9LEPT|nr:RNA-binding protein [Leptospira langatensis]TGK01857.1 RNA-binding protein [Leptospira langatensis]TGL39462.1 RNA-binding protein [Leptospira langatensis]